MSIAGVLMRRTSLPSRWAYLADEVVGQQEDVVLPLAERRQEDREDVDAVVEVLAEKSRLDERLQVAVGGGDDPHVGLDRAIAAHALELALLQDAEQLDLHGGREVADLVEEERAAVGLFDAADAG